MIFFSKNPKGGGGGVDGRTHEQAETNMPLKHLRSWGNKNA